MYTRRQAAEIIDKLIELTQHRSLVWTYDDPPPRLRGPDVRVEAFYSVKHIGRNLRLYRRSSKTYIDDVDFYWEDSIVLEFVDDSDVLLAELPETPNAKELLRAVQFQDPAVGGFYADLFRV